MHKITQTFLFFLFSCICCSLQVFPETIPQHDEDIFREYLHNIKKENLQEQITETALFFLDAPYVASTLEANENEKLVINLREFDCTTFIENCIALTRTALLNTKPDFVAFQNELQQIRYRNGIIKGYTSRLHYITDWIYENSRKEIISDRTKNAGGINFPVKLSFMSAHPTSYPALTSNPENIQFMQDIENLINSRKDYYYFIPKENLKECEKNIRTGDIIFFTTRINGLDVMHAGIAYRQGETLSFIHASSLYKRVIINPTSLTDYCLSGKNISGIIIVSVEQ